MQAHTHTHQFQKKLVIWMKWHSADVDRSFHLNDLPFTQKWTWYDGCRVFYPLEVFFPRPCTLGLNVDQKLSEINLLIIIRFVFSVSRIKLFPLSFLSSQYTWNNLWHHSNHWGQWAGSPSPNHTFHPHGVAPRPITNSTSSGRWCTLNAQ